MKVLSMDQSTTRSGWCLKENGVYVCSGVVDMTKSKLDTDKRSFEMAKGLWKVIDKYKPDHLVLENVQQQAGVKTVIILSRLAGMIIGYAEAHKVNVHIVSPSQWRKVLNYAQGPKVKRQELKQQSFDYVKENYNFDLSEDESEAICINDAAHKIFDFDDDWGN